MKVLIAAGGTGGHIYPGIAVAKEILRRNGASEVLFVGTARGLETRIVPENGFQLSLINSAGLKNVGLAGQIKGLSVLPKSFIEARKIIRQFRPHVVVLDIAMPKMNGYDACRRIRSEPWGQSMTLIAQTGWDQTQEKRRIAEAGFDAHVIKPVDHAALLALIESLSRQP